MRKKVTATKCGHKTALEGPVTAYGTTIRTKITPDANGSTDFCLNCLAGMAIQCGGCGLPIFIGDGLRLILPQKALSDLPEGVYVYREEPLTVPACLRPDCCSTIASWSGNWLPDAEGHGYVQRIPSAFELLANADPDEKVAAVIDDLPAKSPPRLVAR